MRIKLSPIRFFLIFFLVMSGLFFSLERPSREVMHEKPLETSEFIEVKPVVKDEEIIKRLEGILQSTNWFIDTEVQVKNGVVFLKGKTDKHQFKDWAGDLAKHTQDVAAVVNQIEVVEAPIWNLSTILSGLQMQLNKILQAFPMIIFGAIILFISWILARLVYKIVPLLFRNKMHPSLLREVIVRGISISVFLLGVYFIFEMVELTTMAMTIISGTGIIGIIFGIAFRDITENFLASVLLSLQNPFRVGDLIDIVSPITGYSLTGFVEKLTLRATILVSLEGNHVQIPNATVYKSNIRNYTTNPHHRDDFVISIPGNHSISKAENSALKVVVDQEAVLKDPEPLVLVDSLNKEQVNLRIYYWIDASKHNLLKVKSTIIRLVKQALEPGLFSFSEVAQTPPEKELKHDSQKGEKKGVASPEVGENLLASQATNREKSGKGE